MRKLFILFSLLLTLQSFASDADVSNESAYVPHDQLQGLTYEVQDDGSVKFLDADFISPEDMERFGRRYIVEKDGTVTFLD